MRSKLETKLSSAKLEGTTVGGVINIAHNNLVLVDPNITERIYDASLTHTLLPENMY